MIVVHREAPTRDRGPRRPPVWSVRALLGSRCTLAFTGVADAQEGEAVGTVFMAAVIDERAVVVEHHFSGPPTDVRAQAVERAAAVLCSMLTA